MTVGDYKEQDDFILVRRFMSTELGIQSKNEMLLYALIYSYSDGGSAFYGSTEYLAKRLGSSKSRIIKVLNEMVSKGLIIKKTSGKFNFYVTNFDYVCNTDEPPVSVQHPERCQIDEGFLDQHAKERLKREQEVLEREHEKHQKKLDSTDWLKIISKGENYGNIKSDSGRKSIGLDEE